MGLGVGLGLGCFFLAFYIFSDVSECVLGNAYGIAPLSVQVCVGVWVWVWGAFAWRSADHQPNARSAQTGEADKLMERSADHDPTGWGALRTMIQPGTTHCSQVLP